MAGSGAIGGALAAPRRNGVTPGAPGAPIIMVTVLVVIVGLMLAFANGANDNFKPVATLLGSGTTSYRRALGWASVTTLAGSVTALFLAGDLIAAFSGKGLVPPALVADPRFPAAVGLAAAITVLLATRLGFPVSTTHALMGGLVGAGWAFSYGDVNFARLGSGFVRPLLVSPAVSIAAAVAFYPALSWVRRRHGVERDTCACIGELNLTPAPAAALSLSGRLPILVTGSRGACRTSYNGTVLGISAGPALDAAHYLSAGVVGFARGLNDTPKIAALLLAGEALPPPVTIAMVAATMLAGGVVAARRVAHTMSHRITAMNAGQGFTANIVTGLVVVGASRAGLPVSTTHVSAGALFGIGAVTGGARWRTIGEMVLAWIVTLPVAAVVGALSMTLLK